MIKVLIVESDELTRRSIIMTVNWASLGCMVAGEVADGGSALELAAEIEPSLIISEIDMPKTDGLEMLRHLRDIGCAAQMIFLTAQDGFSCIQSALRLGAADYLLKPFSPVELEQAILRLRERLEHRTARDVLTELPPLPEPGNGVSSKYVAEALNYINRHYSEPGTGVGSMAKYLGMSEGYLSHLFKKETGCTPHACLAHCRIRKAMELLRDCRSKVYEVAEQVGYRDIAYFSATFKKMTGISPSEYQDKCK